MTSSTVSMTLTLEISLASRLVVAIDEELQRFPRRCDICGQFTDARGRCSMIDGGEFDPAEHW